jgi:hypothetical protein
MRTNTPVKEQEVELLSETGKNLLELKKVLIENKENPLIYNGLVASVSPSDYEEAVFSKLMDENVSLKVFESTIVQFEKYTNASFLKKLYADFQKKVSTAIEKKGQKYFSTESSPKHGGVVIVRKFGINLEFIKREFRLTDKEARKLLKDGFIEKYSNLKLHSIMKDMVSKTEKQFQLDDILHFELTDFYYNEIHEVFSIDFRIVIPVGNQYVKPNMLTMNFLVNNLDNVLKFIQKEYYKQLNGNKE